MGVDWDEKSHVIFAVQMLTPPQGSLSSLLSDLLTNRVIVRSVMGFTAQILYSLSAKPHSLQNRYCRAFSLHNLWISHMEVLLFWTVLQI